MFQCGICGGESMKPLGRNRLISVTYAAYFHYRRYRCQICGALMIDEALNIKAVDVQEQRTVVIEGIEVTPELLKRTAVEGRRHYADALVRIRMALEGQDDTLSLTALQTLAIYERHGAK